MPGEARGAKAPVSPPHNPSHSSRFVRSKEQSAHQSGSAHSSTLTLNPKTPARRPSACIPFRRVWAGAMRQCCEKICLPNTGVPVRRRDEMSSRLSTVRHFRGGHVLRAGISSPVRTLISLCSRASVRDAAAPSRKLG